ncbi:MAG: nicotinate (nicotinamide) nucleotide adenylyltransferase [Candidatus Nanoarchaeia archaeon]|nr:nicotinate (nicotinamide) nucleotide adenylyltransferase [Candidatus Nanoarchaeia archaeon]MDD5740464.1 nicotinate (nicotinamide) nucleotide adenylyltransferase [Candidatus Nanoarchaeia archaeon]
MTDKKIALFGGSFNPIHNHHVKMANTVLEEHVAEEVWIIPSKNHPYNKNLAPAKDRINMIQLAFDNPKVKINRTEIESNETNYTIRTIKKLKKKHPHEFYWVIGADVLYEMENNSWYGLNELLKETEFIIFSRKGYSIKQIPDMRIKAALDIKTHNESSTEIRERIRQGKSLKDMVPFKVEEYIQKKGLYK